MEQIKQQSPEKANQDWLIFKCCAQEYGIGINNVQELSGYKPEHVTRVAKAPAHVQGLINLRGQIIPVIDLRLILGSVHAEVNDKTVIVILNIQERFVGAIVDSVSDVLEINKDDIQKAPKPQDVGNSETLVGLFNHEDRLIQLLDIERTIDLTAQISDIVQE